MVKPQAWKTYVLTETILNPLVDRRRNDWRFGVHFEKGLVLRCDSDTHEVAGGKAAIEILSLHKDSVSRGITARGRFAEIWALIVPKLELRETPEDLLYELKVGYGASAEKILLYMLAQKRLSELELRLIVSSMIAARGVT